MKPLKRFTGWLADKITAGGLANERERADSGQRCLWCGELKGRDTVCEWGAPHKWEPKP